MNKVNWTDKAVKQIRKIPLSYKNMILAKVDMLRYFPGVANADIKQLKGRGDYRLRVGKYRVIFEYETEIKIIIIEEVKKRDERTY